MLNPPLLVVSALFFLALSTALYLGAWLAASAILRVGRGRLSHTGIKRVLMSALVLPPLAALAPTIHGSTLSHLHDAAAAEHHSRGCQVLFVRLFAAQNWLGGQGLARDAAGALTNGVAWLLLGIGVFLVVRLFSATARLERGLAPFQNAPSSRLTNALVRVGARFPGLPAARFFECPVPPTYSSVIGFRNARCVLSREFIAAATDDELDAVVAHEASHLRAGDVRATFLVGALNCLFFYVRPVRLLGRGWREAAELACDDSAVAATRKPLALASAILRASGALPAAAPYPNAREERGGLPAVALPFADEAACSPSKRVERLMAQAQNAALPVRDGETRFQSISGWAVTGALALVGAGAVISPAAACIAHCSLEAIARALP